LVAENIHDQFSEDIIRRTIIAKYQGVPEKPSSHVPYSEFLKLLESQSEQLTPRQIIEQYQLDQYHAANQKMSQWFSGLSSSERGGNYFTFRLPISVDLFEQDKYLIALSLLIQFVRFSIPLRKIPIIIIHDCRPFDNRLFQDTIGDFNDFVPILLDKETDRPKKMEAKISKSLRDSAENKIFFHKYFIEESTAGSDEDVNKFLFVPEDTRFTFNSNVLFRFNAHYDLMQSDELYDLPSNYDGALPRKYMPQYSVGWYFYVYFENDTICINGHSPIHLNLEKLETELISVLDAKYWG
jgi:hypothetical protein